MKIMDTTKYGLPEGELTHQSIFTHVLRHMREMGEPCIDDYGVCSYRGAGGAACAVGSLISDSDYDSSMEGREAYVLAVNRFGPTIGQFACMLEKLQEFHDSFWPDGVDPVNLPLMQAMMAQFSVIDEDAQDAQEGQDGAE